MLAGVYVDRDALPDVPMLVIGAGLDRQFAEADSARPRARNSKPSATPVC